MSRQHGYSLLELMVALAIIGVVTATVIPITDTQLKANRLKADADAVRNLVGLAKMRASSRFTRARVLVNVAANSYVLQVWDKTAACVGERRCSDTHVHRGALRVWHAGDSAAEHSGQYRSLATLHHRSDGGRGDRQYILHQLQLARTAGRCRRGCFIHGTRSTCATRLGFSRPPSRRHRSSGSGRRQMALRPGDHGEGHMNRLKRVASLHSKEAGFSLLETMVALMIVFVAAAGLLPLGIVAFSTSENQGHLSARAAEYAQDKLEQLMALWYGDTTSDTRVFPALESRRQWPHHRWQRQSCCPGPDVCGLPGYRWSADSICQRRPAQRLVLPARLASDEPASQPQADHSDGDSRSIGRRVGAQAPRHGRCAQDVSVLKGGGCA